MQSNVDAAIALILQANGEDRLMNKASKPHGELNEEFV